MSKEDKIKYALENTKIIKKPEKLLSTFDSTTIHYYLLAVPMYLEFEGKSSESETVIREGKITWEKPKLLTPSYILRIEGFSSEAKEAFELLTEEDRDLAMILYNLKLKRDSEKMDIVSESISTVSEKIIAQIEKRKDPFCAVIKGVDEFWDVSLSKFIQDLIIKSAYFSQFPELLKRNVISVDKNGYPVLTRDGFGIPMAARIEIENLFRLLEKGDISPSELKEELDRWDLFEEYQDRFFNYFKKRRP